MNFLRRLFIWLLQGLRSIWLCLGRLFEGTPHSLKFGFIGPTNTSSDLKQYYDNVHIVGKRNSTNSVKVSAQQKPLPFSAIPSAEGWPIVGTFFDFLRAGAAPQLHKYIDRRHHELGDIFRERLGGTQDAVFVASANLMRSVFLHEGAFPKHPVPDAWQLYNQQHKCPRGLFFMNGEEWLHNRKILNRVLLSGKVSWIKPIVEDCTERFVDKWRARANSQSYTSISDLEQSLYAWAVEVICCVMFGAHSPGSYEVHPALEEFACVVHKIFACSAVLMNFPPKLARLLNLHMWRDFERQVSLVLQKGSDIIESYIGHVNAACFMGEGGLFGQLQHLGMSLDMIKRIFVDLVIAAGDTTAYTCEWALYLLAINTKLQERIAQEAQAELQDLSTVRGLLKETLRLYPVAPFIGRYLAHNAVLGNYQLPQGTLVLLSLYTAGRNATHFPQPLQVQPERWLRSDSSGALNNVMQAHGSLPFAIGSRSCIGRKVATLQLESLLAAICRNFELKSLSATPIESVLRLVTVPSQPLELTIKLRT